MLHRSKSVDTAARLAGLQGGRGVLCAAAGAVLLLAAFRLPQRAAAAQQDYRVRVETDLVVLYTTVTGKDGRPVADLTEDQFHVFENGKEQPLKIFNREDAPVSVGLIIDNSGSMRDKRQGVNAAALKFVQSSNPHDEVFIVNFNENAFLDADFTDNVNLMKAALERIDARGGTALYDALDMSLRHMTERAMLDKKVLIAVTDGEDNASQLSLEQLVESLEHSNVMVYTVGLISGDTDEITRRAKLALENISKATGARSYFPSSPAEVLTIAGQIAEEIRNQYVLAYTPADLNEKGFRKLEVRVNAPNRGKLIVRSRTGYYPQSRPASPAGRNSSPRVQPKLAAEQHRGPAGPGIAPRPGVLQPYSA